MIAINTIVLAHFCLAYFPSDSIALDPPIEVVLCKFRSDADAGLGLVHEHSSTTDGRIRRRYTSVSSGEHGCIISGDRRSVYVKTLPSDTDLIEMDSPYIARKKLGRPISQRIGDVSPSNDGGEQKSWKCDVCQVWRCWSLIGEHVEAVEVEMWFHIILTDERSTGKDSRLLGELQGIVQAESNIKCTSSAFYKGKSSPLGGSKLDVVRQFAKSGMQQLDNKEVGTTPDAPPKNE